MYTFIRRYLLVLEDTVLIVHWYGIIANPKHLITQISMNCTFANESPNLQPQGETCE